MIKATDAELVRSITDRARDDGMSQTFIDYSPESVLNFYSIPKLKNRPPLEWYDGYYKARVAAINAR